MRLLNMFAEFVCPRIEEISGTINTTLSKQVTRVKERARRVCLLDELDLSRMICDMFFMHCFTAKCVNSVIGEEDDLIFLFGRAPGRRDSHPQARMPPSVVNSNFTLSLVTDWHWRMRMLAAAVPRSHDDALPSRG